MQAAYQFTLPPVDYIPEIDMTTPTPEHSQPVVMKGSLGFVAHRLGVPPWGQLLILALSGIGWLAYSRMDKMNDHFVAVDQKLATLPLEISNTLLSQAQTDMKLGRYDHAIRATEAAKAIVAKAAVDKIAAPQGYFEESLSALNAMRASATDEKFRETVHGAQILLANYRSALEPSPREKASSKTVNGPMSPSEIEHLTGTNLVFESANPDTDLFQGPVRLENLTVIAPHGGYVLLDGSHFDGVVFVGVRVQYRGGPIDLSYVRFVNCTFDSVPEGNGPRFIDYVTLAENKLSTTS